MDTERVDILNRDKFVEDVFKVIEALSANRQSRTFAINGEWGSGKSFVLDMLEEKLSMWQNEETADDKYIVFHYNCWKYDYYDEPLFAIVTAMYDWIKTRKGKFETHARNLLIYTLIAFGLTTKEFAINTIEDFTNINFEKVGKEAKEIIESINNKGKLDDELSTVQESIDFTKGLISEIAKEQTVIVVVDELDRCLPEYAIKVLERLHHLFDDVENLIVILAVDKDHLNNTVSQIFGFDKENSKKDIDSYLAKFIDFEIPLDKGIVNSNYKEKYREYFDMFEVKDKTLDVDQYISLLFKNDDSRKRDKIFEKAALIHNMVFDETVDIAVMCVELLWVLYEKIAPGNGTSSSDVVLPGIIIDYKPDFSKFFEVNIKSRIVFSRVSEYVSDAPNHYNINSREKGIRELIVYLMSKAKNFRYNTNFPAFYNDKEIVYLTERMEMFDELCRTIK